MSLLLVLLLATPPRPPAAHAIAPLAITHVTVIDGAGAPPQKDMTVILAGGRITAVGASGQTPPPKGARVLEASGKFLIPGLWDMHGHLCDATEAAFPLLVANGITGVRDLGGELPQLDRWRAEIERGDRLGPQIVRAGPFVDGSKPGVPHRLTVTTPEEARRAVDSLKTLGVDFIKVHNLLPREAFFALTEEARKQHLPVAVHLPKGISSAEASDAGAASLEHIETLIESALFRQGATAKTWDEALAENSGAAGAEVFRHFVQNGTRYVPTLVAYRRGFELWGADTTKIAKRRVAFLKLMNLAREMHRAGVEILAGSDFTEASVGIVPGADLHEELALLVEIGMSPMEAIQAATIGPARFLGREATQGTIAAGKRADLVLLDADPLDNINNTRTIDTVVIGGRVVPVAQRRRELAAPAR